MKKLVIILLLLFIQQCAVAQESNDINSVNPLKVKTFGLLPFTGSLERQNELRIDKSATKDLSFVAALIAVMAVVWVSIISCRGKTSLSLEILSITFISCAPMFALLLVFKSVQDIILGLQTSFWSLEVSLPLYFIVKMFLPNKTWLIEHLPE